MISASLDLPHPSRLSQVPRTLPASADVTGDIITLARASTFTMGRAALLWLSWGNCLQACICILGRNRGGNQNSCIDSHLALKKLVSTCHFDENPFEKAMSNVHWSTTIVFLTLLGADGRLC